MLRTFIFFSFFLVALTHTIVCLSTKLFILFCLGVTYRYIGRRGGIKLLYTYRT
jgi:hypothetical protein